MDGASASQTVLQRVRSRLKMRKIQSYEASPVVLISYLIETEFDSSYDVHAVVYR